MNVHLFKAMLKPRKVFSHPPSAICLFPISPSQSLPLQTLHLVSLVSLITKTKRIAERSAIVTGCQDDRMTGRQNDRQRILGKYMIDDSNISS